jgi:DeoR family fructose operon transcriptional repressor
VANLFLTSPTTDVVLVGGYIHSRTGVAIGPYADDMIARLNVRRTILSVASIDDEGYYNSNLLLVETERAMMRAANEVIVVADSTKFGYRSLARLAGLSEVQRLVVDNEITQDWRSKLVAAGVSVIIAGTTDNGEGQGSGIRKSTRRCLQR